MTEDNSEKSNKSLETAIKFELTFRHYNTLFSLAIEELDILLQSELPLDEPKTIEERPKAIRIASRLYVKYIQLANKFIKCYENLANPQKRIFLRKICDGCIGRILELKNLMVAWEVSDFHYSDQTALGMRLFPHELDVKIPEYFLGGKTRVEKERREIVERYLTMHKEKELEKKAVTKEQKMNRLRMVYIRIIQSHERVRQAREYFHEAQKQCLEKELKQKIESMKLMTPKLSRMESAAVIQRAWRKYHFRKVLNRDYEHEMKLLKMMPSSSKKEDMFETIQKYLKLVIKREEEEYLKKREEIKQDILMYKAPEIVEELEECIRSYFHKYKDINGVFPKFPTEEDGGSKAMLEIPPEGFSEPSEKTEKDFKSAKSSKGDKADKSGKKSKENDDDKPETYTFESSKYVPGVMLLLEAYHTTWANENLTTLDKFQLDILTEDVEKEVCHMIRLLVDEKMRDELQRLTDAMHKDSKKKKKKEKKKKKKAEKDITLERTLESLVEELVYQNIIHDYPKHNLNEFIGEYNLSGTIYQLSNDNVNEPLPCLADIKRVINEYCILPMGSDAIHSSGSYVKSILLAGPRGSGKTFLVHSICTEIGATLIDLSAENIDGKYPEKDGLKMLLHLVLKVGRLLQPTVIYIKDAENYFWKKRPLKCPLAKPGRLKKQLPLLLKKIKDTDRILICGTTNSPFDADIKGIRKSYSKIIGLFKPDYDCRVRLWREFISKAVPENSHGLQFSVLGNISDGFVALHLRDTVSQVLTRRRLSSLKNIPLCASDFVLPLSCHVPVYEEEHQEYLKWLKKLPLGKKRLALYEEEKDEEDVKDEEGTEEDDY